LISPFFSSLVLGASTIIEAGTETQKQKYLPDIAEGKKIITLAILEKSACYEPEAIFLQATDSGNEFVLQGNKLFVSDANSADYIICLARTQNSLDPRSGLSLFLVETKTAGVTCNFMETISPDKQYEVVFDNVKVTKDAVLGQINKGWIYLEKVIEKAAAATCAQMVGGAERVLDLTTTYAKDRAAFGHPIGAYQSIQHRCADMLMDVETSRFATFQAIWKINERLPATKEVSIAKYWVSQAFHRVVTSSHQIHGAIGFTEDHVLHWYTKRAKAQEVNYGDVNFHLNKLANIAKSG
jgi:alkylation response protein AidB-like acyl-CoA dehydrogenase